MDSQDRTDALAANTSDEDAQMKIAEHGDTEQFERLLFNPNLRPSTIAWIVERRTFNPTFISKFAAHPNMTPESAARIRPW